MPVEQDWGLLRGLTDETGEQWHICYKEGRLSVSKWHRIINYIIFCDYSIYELEKIGYVFRTINIIKNNILHFGN